MKYAVSLGCSYTVLSSSEGHIITQFRGKGVHQAFRHESGKHCVQRVPPTESKGRRHTSIVAVAVLPLPPENRYDPLPDKDIEITTQTGKQKAGGQNVNKVASAVRIKHKPTGLSVFINGRDQAQNRKYALRILTAKVNDHRNERINQVYHEMRKKTLGSSGRGDKIRTYNFIECRIIDHRLGTKTHNVKEVMKGDFKLLFGDI